MQNGQTVTYRGLGFKFAKQEFSWWIRVDFVDVSTARGRANFRGFKWPISAASNSFS